MIQNSSPIPAALILAVSWENIMKGTFNILCLRRPFLRHLVTAVEFVLGSTLGKRKSGSPSPTS